MHFSRSLAGVALLGVFAAMAFAGAATGAPAQSEKSQAEVPFAAQSLDIERLGTSRLTAGRRECSREEPVQGSAEGQLGRHQHGPQRSEGPEVGGAVVQGSPAGINATAAATQQPIGLKNPAVLSKTGVNAWQQETFGGYNLEPPDPSLCAGQGFVVQVVNSQVQISDGNLNHLTAPISMESFFGDFANALFDPLCSYNHSTGRFYMTEAVSDFATFSGVYIAVSTSSDPRGPWNIYFLDLGTFGGDDEDTVGIEGCANGLCLADQPNLGSDQYTISISTNQFDMDGDGTECGILASVVLRTCSSTRSRWRSGHRSRTSSRSTSRPSRPSRRTSTSATAPTAQRPVCWYSIQPADAANGRYDTRNGGQQWAMSALDFVGLSDNRVALWRFDNTQTIGAFIPDIDGFLSVLHYDGHSYSNPPLAAQPQNPTSPVQPNGNPLGDFLVLAGICPAGSPPGGCSNPGPIQTNDDRMRDTMMTTIGTCNAGHTTCSRIMWGGLTTAIGGRAGVQLFGVTLGSTGASSSAMRTWTIHNPSNDVYFPSVSILDNGQALATYTVSGSARYRVGRVLDVHDVAGSWRDPGCEPGPRRVGRLLQLRVRLRLWPPPLGRLLRSSDDGQLDLLHGPVRRGRELLAAGVPR